MVSKKYTLLAVLFCLFTSYGFAQTKTGGSYDVSDSSVIPSKRMPQHTEFLNGTYDFPARPRDQWEIGFKYGLFNVSGDVPSKLLTAPNFGVHIRKSLGYVFSLRLEYIYGIGEGLHYRWAENYSKNGPWRAASYSAPIMSYPGTTPQLVGTRPYEPIYYNYKTQVQDLSIQGIISLNNIKFHRAQTKVNVYAILGVGGTIYDTKVNMYDENWAKYPFATIQQAAYEDRKDVKKALKDMLDDTYETRAQTDGDRRPTLFDDTFRPSATFGLGLAFKLSNKLNLAIEDRITVIKDDLLDGQQWAEQPWGDASKTGDADLYNFGSVGLNFNLGRKRVEPLYWLNPLDYAYSEIRNPKLMRLPKPVLPDSDGDGVTDQFDQEQTPAGVPVDTHGVSRDTDGDGVPDSKDKELVTPTYCQPVDADGVGKCPCPDPSCYEGLVKTQDCASKLGSLPSITFKAGSNNISDDAKTLLATVASQMRNNPECRVVVIGYCSSSKKEQQLSWDHVNKVITHLVEKEGISSDRFIFNYGQEGGDCNTVDLRGANTDEQGPNTVAPPHPNLRKK